MSVTWKPIAEHPKLGHGAPRVLVWGQKTGVEFGRVYHYPDGYLKGQAEGFHGDWGITHYADAPEGPRQSTTAVVGRDAS